MNADEIDALTRSIQYTRLVSYVGAGSIAILVYDTLITLDQEIQAIWKSKWNYPRLLYVLTRYSSFIEAAVIIALLTVPGNNYTLCSIIFQSNAWLFVFGVATGELIMTIRTWAVWQQKQAIKYVLIGSYVTLVVGAFSVTGLFVRTLEFAPNPRTPYIGCYATRTDPIVFVSWVLLLLYDTLMFCLMAISAFKAFRQGGSSRLLSVVYKDGLSYYVYLFALSALNITVALTFPPDLLLIISTLAKFLHSMLACRVVLHIDNMAREATVSSWNSRSQTGPTNSSSYHKRSVQSNFP